VASISCDIPLFCGIKADKRHENINGGFAFGSKIR